MLCAPILSQEAAVEALKTPEKDIGVMKKAYDQRRNFIYNSFLEMGIPVARPRGAFYIFPYIGDFGLESKAFALRLLDEQNVAAVPGTAFGSDGEGYLRCSYATGMEELKEAVHRIRIFTDSLKKGKKSA